MNSKKITSLNRLDAPVGHAVAEDERRREPRLAASGDAVLSVVDQPEWRIEGALLDTSNGGFRLLHSHGGLTTGTVVRFQFDGRQGTARVCWNRIERGKVETGFYILSRRGA
jgi:PilZ domain